MADAPSGGGGLSGGEIILLVVLGLGALTVLSGHPIAPFSNSNNPSSSRTSSGQSCGIAISRPASKEIIGGYATVVGTITPCDNNTPLNTTVNVQIVDSTGAPMSAYTPVSVGALDNNVGTFNANIPIIGNPAPGTGYVIVTGPNNSNGITVSARVGVKFTGQNGATNVNTGAYFVPNPNPVYVAPQTTTTYTTNTSQQTYTNQNTYQQPVQQNPQPTNNTGSTGNTF